MILFYKIYVMKNQCILAILKNSAPYYIAFIENFNIEFALIGKTFVQNGDVCYNKHNNCFMEQNPEIMIRSGW